MAEQLFYFNGVDIDTGGYDIPPLSTADLDNFLRNEAPPANQSELKFRAQKAGSFAVMEGVDPKRLDQTGWGVLFAANADPALEEALSPLLQLRSRQAGDRFHVYANDRFKLAQGSIGYQPGDSKVTFLNRLGAGIAGPADPRRLPYYLLIVGGPDQIPYRFQTQLDVQYAVGRIHFANAEYAAYPRSVVMAESGQVSLARRASLFGVTHPHDFATELSTTLLVEPLANALKTDVPNWQVDSIVGSAATKWALQGLLGGATPPALLFTASHGLRLAPNDPRLRALQGALVCADDRYPGPQAGAGALTQDFYFAADDLAATANLLGMIAFFFACFGAGTPEQDEFTRWERVRRGADNGGSVPSLAPAPFLAQLPAQMLARPSGGALAVIGHIERAYPSSFAWQRAQADGAPAKTVGQTTLFESAFRRLMGGYPVGAALEFFNERYAELATTLADELEPLQLSASTRLTPELAGLWMANNDARGYAIVGDPAVRLPVADSAGALPRPALPVSVQGPADEVTIIDPESAGNQEGNRMSTDETPKKVAGVQAQEPIVAAFSPAPEVPAELKHDHPELYRAYIKHIEAGYQNNDRVFGRVLNAFLLSHYSTLVMYWILFVVGIVFFVAAVSLALFQQQVIGGAVFAGLSVVSFLIYFVSGPTQAVEENLIYTTWLGLIYNSYWTHLAWATKPDMAQAELEKSTTDALQQLNALSSGTPDL